MMEEQYPQVVLNFRLKHVEGLSFDFVHLNLLGFACYAVYTVALFFWRVDELGANGTPDKGGGVAVDPNDVAFAIHAFLLCSVTALQCRIYPRKTNPGMSSWAKALFVAMLSSIVVGALLTICGLGSRLPSPSLGLGRWNALISWLGILKPAISFIKYVPQFVMNYRRQSTEGWSLGNIVLDLTGGLLSLGQQVMHGLEGGDWTTFTANPAKTALAAESIAFDLLFIAQHVAYRHRRKALGEAGRKTAGLRGEAEGLVGATVKTPLLAPEGADEEGIIDRDDGNPLVDVAGASVSASPPKVLA